MPPTPARALEEWVGLFISGVLVIYFLLRVIILIQTIRLRRKELEEEHHDQHTPFQP